jgi:RNA polymerase sigma-70 factor (ECF subfamily)
VETDERFLVEKARKGDMSAFQEIVERHKNQIYYLSLDFTGNHHDAEDVLQEVLIKAHRSLKTFKGNSRLRTWFHRITINTCIDLTRRASPAITSAEDLPGCCERLVEYSPNSNPEKKTEAERIQLHIEEALQQLTPLERSVFILRTYHQLPIKEAAQILGRSEGTVKNMLWRAIQKLQKELSFYRKELGLEASK